MPLGARCLPSVMGFLDRFGASGLMWARWACVPRDRGLHPSPAPARAAADQYLLPLGRSRHAPCPPRALPRLSGVPASLPGCPPPWDPGVRGQGSFHGLVRDRRWRLCDVTPAGLWGPLPQTQRSWSRTRAPCADAGAPGACCPASGLRECPFVLPDSAFPCWNSNVSL